MPKISQLPTTTAVTDYDVVPISQGGAARSASIGTILESVQPVINLGSPSLLGRTSLGPGGPEQVEAGLGLSFSGGTLCANGDDHATFPCSMTLVPQAQIVMTSNGTSMLMPAALLRGLFLAGENVSISSDGVIAASSNGTAGITDIGSTINHLQVTTKLAAGDLIPVSQAGAGRCVSYANLIGGLTIDQAQAAAATSDTDTMWVGQTSNIMVRQTFAAIWSWIAGKLPTYELPITEVTTTTTLNRTDHNGRVLICSQPLTLMPSVSGMGSGFHCTIINASSNTVTLGSGFVTSSGSTTLPSWQTATVYCISYSGGSVAFAALNGGSSGGSIPGTVTSFVASATGSSSILVSWQVPISGGAPTTYIVSYRVTGTAIWTTTLITASTSCQLSSLSSSTSYDVVVQASNANGTGPYSNTVTVVTGAASQALAPAQVTGLSATAASSSGIQVAWTAQSGTNAASSYIVQYRVSGTTSWISLEPQTGSSMTVTGLQAGTGYDIQAYGTNAAGSGPLSTIATATTQAAPHAVSSITWNLLPSGSYAHGAGAIGVNAHVSPATAAIQFGLSQSATIPPVTWTGAVSVNTDLWGAYLSTPTTVGAWYVWAEGTDGSCVTVSTTPFTVQ